MHHTNIKIQWSNWTPEDGTCRSSWNVHSQLPTYVRNAAEGRRTQVRCCGSL